MQAPLKRVDEPIDSCFTFSFDATVRQLGGGRGNIAVPNRKLHGSRPYPASCSYAYGAVSQALSYMYAVFVIWHMYMNESVF